MKYYNMYSELKTKSDLIKMARRDIRIACFWGLNRKRVNDIKEARDKVIKEKRWTYK